MSNRSPFLIMEDYLQRNFDFVHNVVLNKVASVNVMTKELEYFDEYALNSLWVELQRGCMKISKQMLHDYLYSSNSVQFDPFSEYFKGLEAWTPDQPNYFQLLADTVTVPADQKEAWELYLFRWLIALVGCAINPTITNQQVLVLVGGQGIGKTKWTETLVPEPLKDYYYSGNVNPGDKDSAINLSECFLINLDELGNLNKGDLNSLKQLITQSSIRVRRPYATLAEKMPRRASFIGSVNNSEFLRDDTGNRRYLCIDTLVIDYNHGIDISRVYAQAYYLLTQLKVKYWFDGEEIQAVNERNKAYQMSYPELEYVNQYFEPCSRDDNEAVEMTLTEIQNYLMRHGTNILNVSNRMLGIAMKSSEYVRVKKDGGKYFYRLKLKGKPAK